MKLVEIALGWVWAPEIIRIGSTVIVIQGVRAKMARFFVRAKMTPFPPSLKMPRLCVREKMAPFPKP